MSPEEMAEVAHTPPIPLDHGILLELHKELVKEYDNGTEGAVARWLEHMLPQFGRGGAEELEKVHSTVDDFKAWVEQVEAALKVEEAVATTATLLQNWQVKTKAAETLPGAENCTLRVGSRVHMQMQPGQWAAGSVKGAFMSGEVYVKFDDGSEWQGPSTNCAPYKYGRGGPLG